MSDRRTLLVLVLLAAGTIAVGVGVMQLTGMFELFRNDPPPTRAELRALWQSYPDGTVWQAEDYPDLYHRELDLDLRLVFGEELPPRVLEEGTTLDGGPVWPHRRDLPLEGRLADAADTVLSSLEDHPPPPGLPRFGHLTVEDVLGELTSWEVPEADQSALRAALEDILETRLRHPDWPGFYAGATDVLYAVAWLERLGAPLDADRRARILAQLEAEIGEGVVGQDFGGPWSRGGAPTSHAVALMQRVGVPAGLDLDELRRDLQVYWSGMDALELWTLDAGQALRLLDEIDPPANR